MDGALCGLDSASNTFYFSIDEYEMNFSPKIEIENEPTEILINGNTISNYAINDLDLVKVKEPITVKFFYCDSLEKEYQLIFTRFPILQITTNQPILDNPKVATEFRLNDPEFLQNGMPQREFISIAGIELRGGSAQSFPKKSYALELWEDTLGINSVDTSFFGLRNDDDWILDAMFLDKGRMPNRVSMDLWLDFHELPYHDSEPKAKGATRGKFIEVILDQEYLGVYVFSERIDRKQLKLQSFEDGDNFGLLYKVRLLIGEMELFYSIIILILILCQIIGKAGNTNIPILLMKKLFGNHWRISLSLSSNQMMMILKIRLHSN